MSCSLCQTPLLNNVVVLQPCGHLLHAKCAEHVMRSGGANKADRKCPFPGCRDLVLSSIPLFIGDGNAEVDEETDKKISAAKAQAEKVEQLQQRHLDCATALAKSKSVLEDLNHSCAELHVRRGELQRSVEESLQRSSGLPADALGFGVNGDPASPPRRLSSGHSTANGASSLPADVLADPLALQAYILQTNRFLHEAVAASTAAVSQEKAIKEELKELKAAKKESGHHARQRLSAREVRLGGIDGRPSTTMAEGAPTPIRQRDADEEPPLPPSVADAVVENLPEKRKRSEAQNGQGNASGAGNSASASQRGAGSARTPSDVVSPNISAMPLPPPPSREPSVHDVDADSVVDVDDMSSAAGSVIVEDDDDLVIVTQPPPLSRKNTASSAGAALRRKDSNALSTVGSSSKYLQQRGLTAEDLLRDSTGSLDALLGLADDDDGNAAALEDVDETLEIRASAQLPPVELMPHRQRVPHAATVPEFGLVSGRSLWDVPRPNRMQMTLDGESLVARAAVTGSVRPADVK